MAKINFNYYDGLDIYNDGLIEEKLLKYFKGEIKNLENNDESFFYTTEIRKNIINWYPFKKNARILEIGAGVGSVTGALLKNNNFVVSVEGSKRRAEIIYERYKEDENLEIYCGNYNQMHFEEKFDYIVLIGVFEYARVFCGNKAESFDIFFRNIIKNLKSDGKVIIAIENKLGLKYLNGLSEDHFKIPYIGIEDYKKNNKFETFSRNELRNFFRKYGYDSKFYGVFPDYKLPSYIFSENYKVDLIDFKKFTFFNYYDDSINFDFENAAKSFIKGNLEIDISNSFFIEISKNSEFAKVDFVLYQNYRNSEYLIGTSVGDAIYKLPVGKNSDKHLKELEFTHKLLNKNNIKACKINHDESDVYNCEKIPGDTVLNIINNYLVNNDIEGAINEIDCTINYIYGISKLKKITNPLINDINDIYIDKTLVLPISLFDLHFDNIIKTKKEYVLIDMEWSSMKQIPSDYYIFNCINLLYDKLPQIKNFIDKDVLYEKYNISKNKQILFYKIVNQYFSVEKNWLNQDVNQFLNKKNSGNKLLNYKSMYYNKLTKELYDYNLLSFYKKELKNREKEISFLKNNLSAIENNNKCMHSKYDRKIYKLAEKLQKMVDKLLPFKSRRSIIFINSHKFIKKIIKYFCKIIKSLAKFIYKIIIPKSIRRKYNYIIHSSRKISKFLHESYYPNLPKREYVENDNTYALNNKTWCNGKIAVHAHMYYVDLTDEFITYLKNIPFKFDLYISTMKKKSIPLMYYKFKKITNLNKLVIKKAKNSGRDFGPMFVMFGNDLKKYDYILHIHTKKSLRTGTEQIGWRQYLLEGLLGTKELVMQYFELMDNHNVGLAYPSTYKDVPFIAYSWLSNFGFAKKYFEKCGYELRDQYLNFSAGSMFWCKKDAIKELLDLNLTWNDFGKEEGKDEGTLAHAFERIFGLAAKHNNYNFATLGKDNRFHINDDDYNLTSYINENVYTAFNILSNYKVITFDIFDTLVTRKIYEPDDVFSLIDEKVVNLFSFSEGVYITTRKIAEENLRKRKNYTGDINIDEIYEEFGKILKLSQKEVQQIKKIEIETDIDLIIPRKEMLDLYNRLKEKNKELILITDMYYTKDIIECILNKCGYFGYYEILLSSELGFRKDNGTMWNYYYNKYFNIKSIHVGDNDASDIHINIKLNKPNFHVLNGRKEYELSALYTKSKNNLDNKLIKGLIVNKILYNSPFSLQCNKGSIIQNLKDYGYALLGPIMLTYFQWLNQNIDNNYNLLFVSREGYFLQKIYKHIMSKSKKYNERFNYYFLTSRRAVSVPTINSTNDIRKILSSYYDGSLKELIYNRLGIILPKNVENKFVVCPRDLDNIMDIVKPYENEIIANAEIEKNNYLKYIESLDINKGNKNCIIDLGYSGTAQYYLTKLMNENIDGAYFLTSDDLKPLALNDKVYSCFNDTIYDDSFGKHPVGKYSLFLEAFLTSDCGQLIKFDENAKPIYMNSGDNNINKLTEIYKGVIEFIDDLSSVLNKDILDMEIDKDFLEKQFEKIIKNCTFSKDIIDTLKIEDLYCSNDNSLNINEII